MAEEHAKNTQYQYAGNSNLVIQPKGSRSRDYEPTGDPESLFGKIDVKDFGSRAQRDKVSDTDKAKQRSSDRQVDKRKKRKDDGSSNEFGYTSVTAATDDLESNVYRPKTEETKSIYAALLGSVQKKLGDVPSEVVRSATNQVLEILKTESLKDLDKLKEIKSILIGLSSDEFSDMVNLGKKLTDYNLDNDSTKKEEGDKVDGEIGVAVIFGGEDSDKDESDPEDSEDEDNEMETYEEVETVKKEQNGDTEANFELLDIEETLTTDREIKAVRTTNEIYPYDVDAFWLQRFIKQNYKDEQEAGRMTDKAFKILEAETSARDCENELMALTEFGHFELVKTLISNRDVLVWCTKLAKAGDDTMERKSIENIMLERGLGDILKSLQERKRNIASIDQVIEDNEIQKPEKITDESLLVPKQKLDLDSLIFTQGNHLMSKKKLSFPVGTVRREHKGYEEVIIPAPTPKPFGAGDKLIPITKLPSWSRTAFSTATNLNRVQSKVYPTAFESDENMLVCAPTGAGKTNVAMLTILKAIQNAKDKESDTFNLDSFKIVYIAPMKALVQEMVQNFGKRLEYLGIKVGELTGDSQLTKQQITETQIIVTTPEKWDIITRKATDRSYTNLVRLIIIDEIHLLHDDRGPVLEAIVIRTLRHIEETQEPIRLVGLSATLPNYEDVATFLRVKKPDLYFFDNSYRPVPLRQEFVGITEKKAIKRFQAMNEVAYSKVMEQAGKNQVLIFVHSRKETVRTAQAIRDMAVDAKTIIEFIPETSSKEVLATEAEQIKDTELKDLLPYGFAVHHAGMTRTDRIAVEDLFREGHIKVLVSTATLAWGVNLPAHTVIIKGTQIYSPERGMWTELSPQDVLQMLGRAGRPQYDTTGEGIIITSHSEIFYYLSLLNQQLPIESQLISKLADNLNAEIVLGTVRNRDEGAKWLAYSYLYVRMIRNGPLYGVGVDEAEQDPYLRQRRLDLIHAAAILLDSCQLVKYDRKTGTFQGTELGRIASHYYISHRSMATYNQHLKPSMNFIELFRAFALSDEFRFIPVRDEEKLEVSKLLEKVPIPVKEGPEEPAAKINVLLQAYISQLNLQGFALVADMVYVTQSANRILRAMFEMCLRRGWSALARTALDLCKIVDRRSWLSMTPLRQFKSLPPSLISKIERKSYPWKNYLLLDPPQIEELINQPKSGKMLHKYIHQFPKLEAHADFQPITRSLLRVELTLVPDFIWDTKSHGASESFWVLVEDADGDNILYHDFFVLKERYAEEQHYLSFTVPLHDPMPPNYFISIISDRWLHSESRFSLSFKDLIQPEKNPLSTDLYDMPPLMPEAFEHSSYTQLYQGFQFNPIQTQVFNALYKPNDNDNVLLAAPVSSGKSVCAEFALLKFWTQTLGSDILPSNYRALYLASCQETVDSTLAKWNARFRNLEFNHQLVINKLTGEQTADLRILEESNLILATPNQWDVVSRRWKKRSNVQNIGLILADDLHMVGATDGPTYEVVISRMRYISKQTKNNTRFIALSTSLANAKDMGAWIGVDNNNIFNFHPVDHFNPPEIHLQTYPIVHFPSLMLAMSKPTFTAIHRYASKQPAIIYVPSRRQCRLTAAELSTLQLAAGSTTGGDESVPDFLGCTQKDINLAAAQVNDKALAQLLLSGIGFYHEALSSSDKEIVIKLFQGNAIRVLVASRDSCWSMDKLTAALVVIMGTQYFEGKEHRYVDYPVTDVLKMLGRVSKATDGPPGKCVLMCQPNKKAYYKKFLTEALPVESHLNRALYDPFNAEVVTQTITNKQDAVDYLTWTYLYRRLTHNPNYYDLADVTHRHLSDYLSELVEETILALSESQCLTVEDDYLLNPLNLGMIAAYYNIKHTTLDLFAKSMTVRTKLGGLLEILSAATEFQDLPIRHHEDGVLRQLLDQLPVRIVQSNPRSTKIKTHTLLQAHFSRTLLPPDLTTDQTEILKQVVPLLHAAVDVASSNGWLQPALAAMELCQMCVQAMWDTNSPLLQLPHFDTTHVKLAEQLGITSVYDFLEEDLEEARQKVLAGFQKSQKHAIAKVANNYPSLACEFQVKGGDAPVQEGASLTLEFVVQRDNVDEDDVIPEIQVSAPYFPLSKDEAFWVVIGDPTTQSLIAIKRFTIGANHNLALRIPFDVPQVPNVHELNPTTHKLKIFFMADAYLGTDQEFEFELNVIKGQEFDSEEEDEMEE